MNNQFNIHHWEAPDTKDVKTFFHNYFMNGKEFTGWEMQETSPVHNTGNSFIKQYVWVNTNASDEIFKVDVVESFSYEEAKNQFQHLLQQNMRPLSEFRKVPSILGSNAYVNDIEEMYYGLFLVANMVIRVHSVGNTAIACNDFIKELYRILNHRYEEHAAVDSPSESFFSKHGHEISVGESTGLNIQIPVWYKLLLDGPGMLRFHNGQLEYFSDEPGIAHIDLYTIKENAVEKNTLTLIVK
ncbi:hypothetical protein SAMN05518672_1011362 [Chitinophaga sp. CF118]|uniref:hypothetical protein n=1 Tax=Chitinophaga sp. CF118 TaxID=1884367 RepID=UPI0008E4BF45|nr:hypothetical protein [Chitinophaga sp. CF118]SFD26743.1 hypothetical protein SAMN05518672_1011362 [Chitinophaga sp. CF118]